MNENARAPARHRRPEAGRLRTWLLVVILAIAIGVLVQGFRGRMGVDRAPVNLGVDACSVVDAPAGPEDMAVDRVTGRLYVSATDRRSPDAQGDLWLLPLEDGTGTPRRMERDGPADFRPHGMDLVRMGGALHAWVVNHPRGRHTLELFAIEGDTARHLKTVAGDALVSPNDVAAVDTERFYVTNDHGTIGGFARLMEDVLGLNLANALYFDGTRFVEVASSLSFANGVALLDDGAEVAIAEVFGRRITFLDREPMSGRLSPHLLVELDSGADNITVSEDGSLLVAAHPRLLDFLGHARDPARTSATEVFRVVRTAGGARVERVLSDDGTRLSAGSTALQWRDQLWVSGVFAPRLLRCDLSAGSATASASDADP